MTRDEALLILNDHCGEDVDVSVHVAAPELFGRPKSERAGVGTLGVRVMIESGTLRHWRDADLARGGSGVALPADRGGGDVSGRYLVGGAGLEVAFCEHADLLLDAEDDAYGIAFVVAEDVTLRIEWDMPS